VAQSAQALHAWFVPTPEVPVPAGFAAHVARRAVAGDTGSGAGGSAPIGGADSDRRTQEPVLQFVLQALAVAAVALVVLSIAMRRLDQPSPDELKAHENQALDGSLFALDQINREELRAAKARASGPGGAQSDGSEQ